MKRAFITGITGQDGSYLAELLLGKGYEVHGLVRRSSTSNLGRIAHLLPRLALHQGDMTDACSLASIIERERPDEIYNLAAQSHVGASFDTPEYTANVTGMGAARLFEAVRRSGVPARIYQASSSEMFGNSPAPQHELTPLAPQSPYAAAKCYAHWMALQYRENFSMFIACGILFNHESPRRGREFLTRKVSLGIAAIKAGQMTKLRLGDLTAKRDWGWAPEYAEAMWRMLQEPVARTIAIGTGESHSVEEFVAEAFAVAGMDWRESVEFSPALPRPGEVWELRADYTRARGILGWEPKVRFRDIARLMVEADLKPEAGRG